MVYCPDRLAKGREGESWVAGGPRVSVRHLWGKVSVGVFFSLTEYLLTGNRARFICPAFRAYERNLAVHPGVLIYRSIAR
jgi:hypothetical protein